MPEPTLEDALNLEAQVQESGGDAGAAADPAAQSAAADPVAEQLAKVQEDMRRVQETAEKRVHDAQQQMHQARQEFAAYQRSMEERLNRQDWDKYEAQLHEQFEADPAKVVANMQRELRLEQQRQQAELEKMRQAIAADVEAQVLRSNPETAQYYELLDQVQKAPSRVNAITLLKQHIATAQQEAQKKASQQGLDKIGGSPNVRASKGVSRREILAKDPLIQNYLQHAEIDPDSFLALAEQEVGGNNKDMWKHLKGDA